MQASTISVDLLLGLIKGFLQENYAVKPRDVISSFDLSNFFSDSNFESSFLDELITHTGINITGLINYDHLLVSDIIQTFLFAQTQGINPNGTVSTIPSIQSKF